MFPLRKGGPTVPTNTKLETYRLFFEQMPKDEEAELKIPVQIQKPKRQKSKAKENLLETPKSK